jgi:hypothetical protein
MLPEGGGVRSPQQGLRDPTTLASISDFAAGCPLANEKPRLDEVAGRLRGICAPEDQVPMGKHLVMRKSLFYAFRLDEDVPPDCTITPKPC